MKNAKPGCSDLNIAACRRGRPGRRRRAGAWMLVELVVSIALLIAIAAGMALTEQTMGRFNRRVHARQRCLAAAQAQMDSIVASGQAMEETELARLWPQVQVEVAAEPGRGDWEGLTLLKVTAETSCQTQPVRVVLCRYVASAQGGLP